MNIKIYMLDPMLNSIQTLKMKPGSEILFVRGGSRGKLYFSAFEDSDCKINEERSFKIYGEEDQGISEFEIYHGTAVNPGYDHSITHLFEIISEDD